MGGYNFTPPQTFVPGPYTGGYNPFNKRDVYDQTQAMGQNQFEQGQDFQNSQAGLSNFYRGNEGAAGQNVNDLYNPIWQGGGGYTQDQMNNVMASQGLTDIQDNLPSNQLTQDEQSQISGDPYSAYRASAGGGAALQDMAGAGGQAIQNAVSAGATNSGNIIAGQGAAYNAAIDPTKLSIDPRYQSSIARSLGAGQAGVDRAQGDPGLGVTDQYLQQAGMTDQQVQDLATSAARGVGAQFGATKDQLMQNAAAAGTTSPLAIAAAMGGLDRSSAASQADAENKARLDAQNAQRQAAQNVQNTQLNAGQYRAGLGSSNALALQNSQVAANTSAEQVRLAAQQGLTNTQLGAATNLGQEGLQNSQFTTNAAASAAQAAANMNIGVGQSNLALQSGLNQTAEQQASSRAAGLATNRQGINQGNQAMNFNINNAQSGRAVSAYQPWVSAQQEGRLAAQGQQQYYGNQANAATGQQLQGWGISNQGQQAAQQGYAGWGNAQNQVGFGSNFSKAAGGALGTLVGSGGTSAAPGSKYGGPGAPSFGGPGEHGKFIDHNQLIEVGEHDRPEVILPLDPATPPDHQNQWERMGEHLGEAMGIRKRGYAQGGAIGLDDPNMFARNMRSMEEATDPGDDIQGYARGGIAMPRIHMPHAIGIKLNMPIQSMRLRAPIRPEGLPQPKGFGDYKMSMR